MTFGQITTVVGEHLKKHLEEWNDEHSDGAASIVFKALDAAWPYKERMMKRSIAISLLLFSAAGAMAWVVKAQAFVLVDDNSETYVLTFSD